MPKKKKFTETSKPKKEATEKYKPLIYENGKIMIDFSYPFVFNTCSIKNVFINKVKDYKEHLKNNRIIFSEAVNYFSGWTFDELMRESKHNHSIKDKVDLIWRILKQLLMEFNESFTDDNIENVIINYIGEEEIWQIAYKQGIRLIGTRNGSVLKLLFIDYHHLIYPDEWHNGEDFYKYSFCPMTYDVSKI